MSAAIEARLLVAGQQYDSTMRLTPALLLLAAVSVPSCRQEQSDRTAVAPRDGVEVSLDFVSKSKWRIAPPQRHETFKFKGCWLKGANDEEVVIGTRDDSYRQYLETARRVSSMGDFELKEVPNTGGVFYVWALKGPSPIPDKRFTFYSKQEDVVLFGYAFILEPSSEGEKNLHELLSSIRVGS